MNGEKTDIQLRLPARAESVALVRQLLSGVADVLPVEPMLLADMKTAVTEACNNVVLHAYPDEVGTLIVDASPKPEVVTVVVRDHGLGMQPKSIEPDEPSLGLGLPLIAALSDRFEISGGTGMGIQVRMKFCVDTGANLDESENGVRGAQTPPTSPPDESVKSAGVTITPGPMMAPVLGRLTAMIASRADFPLDRLSEAVLVTDALSDHMSSYIPGTQASVTLQDGDGKLDLRFGPLVQGGATQLVRHLELPGFERSLEQLADDVKVEQGESGANGKFEYLIVTLARSR
jgi:anti-sigma regulatory factor (Ser/Thr protein kinase)